MAKFWPPSGVKQICRCIGRDMSAEEMEMARDISSLSPPQVKLANTLSQHSLVLAHIYVMGVVEKRTLTEASEFIEHLGDVQSDHLVGHLPTNLSNKNTLG